MLAPRRASAYSHQLAIRDDEDALNKRGPVVARLSGKLGAKNGFETFPENPENDR
jgi:hypothetical protein